MKRRIRLQRPGRLTLTAAVLFLLQLHKLLGADPIFNLPELKSLNLELKDLQTLVDQGPNFSTFVLDYTNALVKSDVARLKELTLIENAESAWVAQLNQLKVFRFIASESLKLRIEILEKPLESATQQGKLRQFNHLASVRVEYSAKLPDGQILQFERYLTSHAGKWAAVSFKD